MGGRVLRGTLLGGGVGVLALWAVGTPEAGSTHGLGGALTSMGRVAGLLAAYLMLVLVLLMSRLPWFERAVGFDRLVAWHRALGTNTVLLMAAHVGLVIWGYGVTDSRGLTGELWDVVTTYPAMLRGTVAFGLFVLVALTSGRLLRRFLSYEAWWLTHLTTYVALLLVFGHQVENGEDLLAHDTARQVWRLLHVAVLGAVVWWRVVTPLSRAFAHRTRVQEVVVESDDTVSVWIEGESLSRRGTRAGQFVVIRFLRRGLWLTGHPYSLSAPVTDGHMRLTVRAAGGHSAQLAEVPVGTWAVVEGPYGTFTSDRGRAGAPVLLVGGGAGIAPLRALAEQLQDDGRDVVVVVRESRRALLVDELEGVTVHELLGSRSDLGHDPLEASRLGALVPDAAERDVWVCGPTGMTATAVASLLELGVRPTHLHLEEYAL